MRRHSCSACGHDNLEMFLDLGMSPIADAYTDQPQVSETYPLQLGVCTGCWLVQLLEIVDHAELFGADYSFYSSASAPLSAYHAEYAQDVIYEEFELSHQLMVEIGCNDGDFGRHFVEAGWKVLGVDPALGPLAVASGRGLDIVPMPFSTKLAQELLEEHGPAGVVVANHVLAHVEDAADVLSGIALLLDDEGVVYIEVQYLPDLLVNNAFDLVYHEHRNFFSLTSLMSAMERWGLHVADVEFTERQGGSIRVTAFHRRSFVGGLPAQATYDWERWLRSPEAYAGFQGRAERIRERLLNVLAPLTPVVGYGAPAKATTLLNYCGMDRTWVDQVVDTTKAKQGRYMPGTNIPIVAPECVDMLDADAPVLLLAWNYAQHVMRRYPNYEGPWILPIPTPMVL